MPAGLRVRPRRCTKPSASLPKLGDGEVPTLVQPFCSVAAVNEIDVRSDSPIEASATFAPVTAESAILPVVTALSAILFVVTALSAILLLDTALSAIFGLVTALSLIFFVVTALFLIFLAVTALFAMFFVFTAFFPSFTAANAAPPSARNSATTAMTCTGLTRCLSPFIDLLLLRSPPRPYTRRAGWTATAGGLKAGLVPHGVALGGFPAQALRPPGALALGVGCVEAEPRDGHPRVAGVGVDRNPLPLAGAAPALEVGRRHRMADEAAAVQGVAHRARAVVALGLPMGVAAAEAVAVALGDPVRRGDHALDGLRGRLRRDGESVDQLRLLAGHRRRWRARRADASAAGHRGRARDG